MLRPDITVNNSAQISNFYSSDIGTLGWINCDRFYKIDPNDMIQVQVNTSNPQHNGYIIFKDINSVMNIQYSNASKNLSTKVPKNKNFVIVLTGIDENKKPFYFIQHYNNQNQNINVTPIKKTCTLEELEEIFQSGII